VPSAHLVVSIHKAAGGVLLPLFDTARRAIEGSRPRSRQRPKPTAGTHRMGDLEHSADNPLAVKGEEVRCRRSIRVDLVLQTPSHRHRTLRTCDYQRWAMVLG
jgi:hypothetical protein